MWNPADLSRRAIGVACVAIGAMSFSAAGDIIANTYLNEQQFHYHVYHMPDFDQKRAGLGGNGACHCVPASTMNLLAYIANHGYPQVAPGPGYWQAQQNFDTITSAICLLGTEEIFKQPLMHVRHSSGPSIPACGTLVDQGCGTGSSRWHDGLSYWLQSHDQFIWKADIASDSSRPLLQDVAHQLIMGGGRIGVLVWRRYNVIGSVGNAPLVEAKGGHAVSVVRVYRDVNIHGPVGGTVWLRDPGQDNDNIHVQSPFTTRVMQTLDMVFFTSGPGGAPLAQYGTFLNYNPDAQTHRVIEGIWWIMLKSGYSWKSSLTQFQVHQPSGFAGHPHNPVTPHTIPLGPGVLKLEQHPWTGEFLIVNAGSEVAPILLHRYNPLTGESQMLSTPPNVFISESGAVTTCRHGRVFAACADPAGGQHLCYWDSLDGPGQSVPALFPISALAHDDNADRIIAVSQSGSAAWDYTYMDDDIPSGSPPLDVPSSVPLGGNISLAVNPTDGSWWLHSDASNAIFGLTKSDTTGALIVEIVTHPDFVDVQSVDVDTRGNLIVASEANGLIVLSPGETWQVNESHSFHGLQFEGKFRITRSRHNHIPEIHDVPEWDNIPPDEIEPYGDALPDCVGDLARPFGNVGVPDLLQLLSAWGPCDDPTNCPEDIAPIPGGDGVVGVADLLELLSQWGPCPGFE